MNVQNQSSTCEPTPQPQIDRPALKKLIISSLVCSIFMVAEAVGGILANSLAVGTDAAHLLVDLISFIISISSVCLAARRPSARLNFGWYRAEAVGALFSVMFIWVVTIILVGLAILRIINGQFEINSVTMLITSSAGFVLNIVMMLILRGGGHHHHHFVSPDHQRIVNDDIDQNLVPRPDSPHNSVDHPSDGLENSHSERSETTPLLNGMSPSGRVSISVRKPRVEFTGTRSNSDNINVRAAFIHVLGDMVQSIGVVVAALIIYFKPEYKIADPICTFFFSFLVLCTTLHILKDTILILMEGSPKHLNQGEIVKVLLTLPRVKSVHNLRVWTLKYDKLVASVHLVLEGKSEDGKTVEPSNKEILVAARRIFEEFFTIGDCTIQIEELVAGSVDENLAQSWDDVGP